MISVSPLVRCPSCRYSLRGLPSAHQCPECGLEYDDRTIVFSPLQPWRPFVGEGIAIIVFTFIIYPYIVAMITATWGSRYGVYGWAGMYVWPVATSIRLWMAHRRRFYVLLDSAGLNLRIMRYRRRFAWAEVRSAGTPTNPTIIRNVRMFVSVHSRPISLGGLFETSAEAAKFLEVVRAMTRSPRAGADYESRWNAGWEDWKNWKAGAIVKSPSDYAFYCTAGACVLLLLCIGVYRFSGTLVSRQAMALLGFLAVIGAWCLFLAGQWFSDPRTRAQSDDEGD